VLASKVLNVLLTSSRSPMRKWWLAGVCAALALTFSLLTAPGAAAQDSAAEPAAAATTGVSLVPVSRPGSPFAGLFQPAAAPGPLATGSPAALDFTQAVVEPSGRACPGCPKRRPYAAILQTLGINVLFNWVNRTRNPNDEFMVTFHSWWENLRYGMEWDYNSFSINQFGHPYQGNLYFNAGRANGLNFWESAPLAALGSATWEYFGERNRASVNDFVTTTMGGIALGEMFHRAGWLVRDATKTGKERRRGEILAMLLDPITGANRFLNGDAHRVSENPPDLKPEIRVGDFEVGAQFNGEINERALNSTGKPFLGLRVGYNDPFTSPYRVPFDAFNVTLRMGGGAGISEATVRARLYGRYFGPKEHHTEFLVAQAYDYQSNGVFDYGGQSVVAGLSRLFRLSDSVSLAAFGVGGPIVLGAITSPVLEPVVAPQEGEEGGEGEVQRTYDFGPGMQVAAGGVLRVKGAPVVRASYTSFYIRSVSSIEGITGQHYAQYFRLELLAPLWRQLRLGVTGDYINRATYYKDLPDVHQWIPQLRFYLAKVSK
jgi:hypothetical protein